MSIYPCNFVPGRDNGHWHTSLEEAEQCQLRWSKWNVIVPRSMWENGNSKRNNYNKPYGRHPEDIKFT